MEPNSVYASGGAAAAPRTSQVQEELERLQKLLEEAAQTQERIFSRLSGVTRPESKAGADAGLHKIETLVPLADQIRGMSNRLGELTNNYRDLLTRIEI